MIARGASPPAEEHEVGVFLGKTDFHLPDDFLVGAEGLFALLADPTHETLGDDAHEGVCDEEAGDTVIEQRGDGARGVVGVHRGQDQHAREGGAHGDSRRLVVADLTHHHDVGVLAQHRAQSVGEV